MPKMSNVSRVISMTKSDAWTTNFGRCGKDEYKQFCYEKCPHPDIPCKGDCPEMKEYRKGLRKGKEVGV